MSKSSLIGIIIGWSIVFVSIRLATDNVLMFWDLNSFILVLIGPYFAMLIAYSASDVHLANKNGCRFLNFIRTAQFLIKTKSAVSSAGLILRRKTVCRDWKTMP